MTHSRDAYAHPELLISPQELSAILASEGTHPLLLDVRAAEHFAAGHLPEAIHLDLWGFSLNNTDDAPLASFLWMIEHVLALRGVTNERPVVIYGENSDLRAARVFWFLEYFSHPNVRVLDGGVHAWVAAGLSLTTAAATPAPTSWTGTPHRNLLATWRDVRERLGRSNAAILDARSDGEYLGTTVRAARGGAVPGAIHLEWTHNLTPEGTFKSAADLRTMYESAGVTADREVIAYCQGGYRAAHAYLALRLIGYPVVRNYIGSWKEWGDRTDLPIEVPGSTSG
jgi:thiosulfate/3-mercaptopyruvate sulfurtransferase